MGLIPNGRVAAANTEESRGHEEFLQAHIHHWLFYDRFSQRRFYIRQTRNFLNTIEDEIRHWRLPLRSFEVHRSVMMWDPIQCSPRPSFLSHHASRYVRLQQAREALLVPQWSVVEPPATAMTPLLLTPTLTLQPVTVTAQRRSVATETPQPQQTDQSLASTTEQPDLSLASTTTQPPPSEPVATPTLTTEQGPLATKPPADVPGAPSPVKRFFNRFLQRPSMPAMRQLHTPMRDTLDEDSVASGLDQPSLNPAALDAADIPQSDQGHEAEDEAQEPLTDEHGSQKVHKKQKPKHRRPGSARQGWKKICPFQKKD